MPNTTKKPQTATIFENILGLFNNEKSQLSEERTSTISLKCSDKPTNVHHRDFLVLDFVEAPIQTWTHVIQFAKS